MSGGRLKRLWSLGMGGGDILTMNQRNLEYIYPLNARKDFPLSDDKLQTKELLQAEGIPVPGTYHAYRYFFDLRDLQVDLDRLSDFVIKPARGHGGGGILVIVEKDGDEWISAGGTRYTIAAIRRQLSDIIFGIYSSGLGDAAIVEERLLLHPDMARLSPLGLPDVRLILCNHQPILAMTRIPTRASDGKANLHQGALGIGVDLQTGAMVNAILGDEEVRYHPDTDELLIGQVIPDWAEIMAVGVQVARSVPLKYLGVDIAATPDGPKVLEINVRPGLQIQNANRMGMRRQLQAAKAAANSGEGWSA